MGLTLKARVSNIISSLSSSDLQFGFKAKHSTAQCTLAVNEVVNYYTNDGGSCYGILLDAIEAFDTVDYITSFQLLSRKGIYPVVARFLGRSYTCQECSVRWGDHSSGSLVR